MCALTVFLLLFPGTVLDSLWRVNPEAYIAFQSFGQVAFLIMLAVGIACLFAAVGLWRNAAWGVRLALIILSVTIAADLFNAVLRHDYRALIGLPVGAAMIFYLAGYRKADSSSG